MALLPILHVPFVLGISQDHIWVHGIRAQGEHHHSGWEADKRQAAKGIWQRGYGSTWHTGSSHRRPCKGQLRSCWPGVCTWCLLSLGFFLSKWGVVTPPHRAAGKL